MGWYHIFSDVWRLPDDARSAIYPHASPHCQFTPNCAGTRIPFPRSVSVLSVASNGFQDLLPTHYLDFSNNLRYVEIVAEVVFERLVGNFRSLLETSKSCTRDNNGRSLIIVRGSNQGPKAVMKGSVLRSSRLRG